MFKSILKMYGYRAVKKKKKEDFYHFKKEEEEKKKKPFQNPNPSLAHILITS